MKNYRKFPISHIDDNGDLLEGNAYEYRWRSLSDTDSIVVGENHTIIRDVDNTPIEMPYGGHAVISTTKPDVKTLDDLDLRDDVEAGSHQMARRAG